MTTFVRIRDSDERTLLRELTHRFHNELISSVNIVSAAAVRTENPEVKVALSNVIELLEQHADVHRLLTIPDGGGLVDAAEYIRKLGFAMSRSTLSGERVYRLPPLECPPTSAQPTADAVLRFPAVRLFVERACNLHGEFGLSNADAPLVASICRRLDGIPLAIKSAAAGVSFLGVQGLSESLDDSLGLPTKISRSASQRQHSMRATLDWSYGLLTEPQRLVLRRLSIFPSEFTLRAAGAVISDEGRPDVHMIPLISELVTKSLVIAETGGAEPRLRLLHTTRAHAFAKLAESGELDAVKRRFAEYTRQKHAEAVLRDKPAYPRNKQEA